MQHKLKNFLDNYHYYGRTFKFVKDLENTAKDCRHVQYMFVYDGILDMNNRWEVLKVDKDLAELYFKFAK